ncbi:CDC48 family AAA ATPase [Candidatus Woesearchaeota archaeon]|nr:CDC48 family AAA ATPase [Candidatus Woesearchaeota archaeon]
MMTDLKLKVAEAVQDDVHKGIVRVDSSFMREIDVRPGDIVEIEGTRKTVAIVDRAYPGDIGLNIIRMDGLARKNARTSIGEMISVRKAKIEPARKVVIAPAREGIVVRASAQIFKQGLLGRAVTKGDVISLGGTRRRRSAMSGSPFFDEVFNMMEESMMAYGFGDLKFVVADTNPKIACIITEQTEVVLSPEAVEVKDEVVPEVTYEDIGGLEDEITKVREMIELPLKHPEIFERLGIEPPKGVLLQGPPGTGKTLLAKAVANETNAHFISINGPEIMSKYYGQSEENLRKKFEEAEKNAPSIIFIDEIDAIATKREETKGEVERRVVAQLLTLMDGLKSRGKVVVIAATNVPNILDPALRRPGRFDREFEIGVPNKNGRLNILKIHTRYMPLDNWDSFAASTVLIKRLDSYKSKSKELISKQDTELAELKKEIQQLTEKLDFDYKELKELEKQKKSNTGGSTVLDRILSKMGVRQDEIANSQSKIKNNEVTSIRLQDQIMLLETNLAKIKAKDPFIQKKSNLNKIVKELESLRHIKELRGEEDPRTHFAEKDSAEKDSEVLEIIKYFADKNVGIINADYFDEVRKESSVVLLQEISSVTHGFVGADLAALAKESAMIVLRKVLSELGYDKEKSISEVGYDREKPIPEEALQKLKITKEDFKEALKVVRPSVLREVLVEVPNVKWGDIGGLEHVKQELKEAVEWPLKTPEVFKQMGVRPPRGILLYGAPGTGKTLLAKAVANESEANFISIKGPELLSKWVGESEKAVREVFNKARQTSPTIIFFDEIDALAPRRGVSSDSNVTERVVNQLLTEIDGLEAMSDVIVIGATNRPDMLDTALLRPGRFDRIILTPVPDKVSRLETLKVHTKNMPLKDISLDDLADRMEGYVGADIEAVCREAAIIALRENIKSKNVHNEHFEKALQVVSPSVTKDVEKTYEDLRERFRGARAKEMKKELPIYFG